jgi:hypothetical protein
MFLRIVSPTVCPVEGFTVLGVSSSRGKESMIGQFGSGNKHAVNLLLRHRINPLIYCGTTRLEFFTVPKVMGNTQYNQVCVKVSNRKPVETSMAVEYGELDWQSISMAMREFVSNAIDCANGDAKKITIDVVDSVTARPGKTIVAVPLTPEVQEWFSLLHTQFLHFRPDGSNRLTRKVLPKAAPGAGMIYRKGVLVRTTGEDRRSLFDYNFGEELRIDEARNLNDHDVGTAAAAALANSEHLTTIFRALSGTDKFWELDLDSYHLAHYAKRYKEKWLECWHTAYGSKTVITQMGTGPFTAHAERKGYQVVAVPNVGWYNALVHAGIPTLFSVLDNVNSKGHTYREAAHEQRNAYDTIWAQIEAVDMTNGKEKPPVKVFEQVMQGGEELFGYYSDGVVYLREDCVGHHQTILEEFAHYITGSTDMSRDFQDWAFRFAVKMLGKAVRIREAVTA